MRCFKVGAKTCPVPCQQAVKDEKPCDPFHFNPLGDSAASRKPAQLDIKEEQEKKPQPEDGHGDAKNAVGPCQVIKDAVSLDG